LPAVNPEVVRKTREALHMSRQVFAFKLGVNPRTLERWEQGRSKPNEQAAALIWLVRKYPDTLERLESLSVPA
jgi:putative transcriptional regulator